ncbi:cupin-like domain-containing protein [Bartonella tribocorum]|uniref:cupin-like domain-containing protein n=1 Tax=Bartonella tribocorum TaxID=85701 RepID=UPI001ABBCCEF|nr:cupin-like domain-containing protein [Bartonella tribocorum]
MAIIRISPEDVIKASKESFADRFFDKTLPVQYKNLDMGMPAYTKWSFDFFKERCVGIYCQVSDDLSDPSKITRKIPIAEYIDLVQNDLAAPYMIGWSYQKHAPELDQDINFPAFHPNDFISRLPQNMQFHRRWIFFGKKGINCDLHIDCFSTSAWLIMIRGQKTFRAISPLQRHEISMTASLFNEETVTDLANKHIDILEYVLTPSTILYVPTGWVHEIRNDSNNIMITGGFTAQQHAIRFYKNYHAYISKNSYESDLVFVDYLNQLNRSEITLSEEVRDSIHEELAYTQEKIQLLKQKEKIYADLLSKVS